MKIFTVIKLLPIRQKINEKEENLKKEDNIQKELEKVEVIVDQSKSLIFYAGEITLKQI